MTGIKDFSQTASENGLVGNFNASEGMAPSQVNDSMREFAAVMARMYGDIGGEGTTTGVADAYLYDVRSDPTALVDGLIFRAKIHVTNTASSTINADNLGSKKIRVFDKNGERDAEAGNLQSGAIYTFLYNASLDGGTGGWLCTDPTFIIPDDLLINTDHATAYTLVEADNNTLHTFTAAANANLTAAATLKDGWFVRIKANGGAVTIDPEGAELIDGVATRVIPDGNVAFLRCTGTAFITVTETSDAAKTAANETSISAHETRLDLIEAVVKNRVQNPVTAASSYSASADRQITPLDTSITTKQLNAKITVSFEVSYERHADGMFYVKRINPDASSVEIGVADSAGSRTIGFLGVNYDTSDHASLTSLSLKIDDVVTNIGEYEYQLWVRGSNQPFFLNRTVTDNNDDAYERGSSVCILQELLV
ncbi:MAG: hypothetical protein JKY96_04755 [Phycisphaerales bacterium]|nr:hypothetical protein [Phycisphaerales bacterium]